MRDQILKLCRRLDKFTFDEILLISEIDSEELTEYLNDFLSMNKLIINNNIYIYNNDSNAENISNSIMSYYPPQIVTLMIRSYCAEVPTYKVAFQVGMAEEQILKFYRYFRSIIYERQYNKFCEVVF